MILSKSGRLGLGAPHQEICRPLGSDVGFLKSRAESLINHRDGRPVEAGKAADQLELLPPQSSRSKAYVGQDQPQLAVTI